MFRAACAATALFLLPGCAQPTAPVAASAPAAPPIVSNDAPAGRTPVILAQSGPCRQVRDGDTIARLQGAAQDLIERLKPNPTFGGAWFDHFPCYRLVLAFTDGQPRPQVVEAAAPELRPYLAFARSKYSEAEREQARLEITAALVSAEVRFALFYSAVNPERFTVQVRTDAEARVAAAAIPIRYRSDTSIAIGDTEPRPE